jgi:hypothetical protein
LAAESSDKAVDEVIEIVRTYIDMRRIVLCSDGDAFAMRWRLAGGRERRQGNKQGDCPAQYDCEPLLSIQLSDPLTCAQ